MRVRVFGESDSATVLRNKLGTAGLVAADKFWDYSIEIIIQDSDSRAIVIDGIPCPFENFTAFHISKLTKSDIILRRQAGKIFSDNQILIELPKSQTEEDVKAVETGCIRALLEIGKDKKRKRWYQVWRTKKATAFLVLLAAISSHGQTQTPTGQVPQKSNISQIGGTVQSGANVVDAANGAIKVSIVATTLTTQDVNLAKYNGITVGAANALHVQPGTGAVFTMIFGSPQPVTQSGSWTVTTSPPANASTNVTQFGGNAVVTGTGVGGSGVPRVTVSSDSFPATQPVSGTVTANVGTTNGLALDATLTGGSQKTKLIDSGGTNIAAVSAAGAVKVDGSAVTQPVSGTVTTTPPSNASTNVAQFGGTNVSTGTGTGGAGIPRVTISSDSFPATQPVSGTVTTSPPANASTNVTQFGGSNVSTGTGVGGAGIPRVTVSSDSFPANQPISGTVTATQVAGANLHVNCDSGCGGAAADTTASGTLSAACASINACPANSTVQVALAGLNSASVTLPSGNNLSATIQADSSSDGGTTWQATVIRQAASGNIWANSFVVASSNSAFNIQVPGGASHVRVRVNPYTSGIATAGVRAVAQQDAVPDPLVQGTQAPASSTQPNPLGIGGWDYTNNVLRTAAVDPASKAILALVLLEPLLNTATCSDCIASVPNVGDILFGNATPKWADLAGATQSAGGGFLNETRATLTKPVTPTLTVSNTGGSYSNGSTIFVQNTYVNSFGETDGSSETSILLSNANGCLVASTTCSVNDPIPALSDNATGVTVYAFSLAGFERQISTCVNKASGTCVITANPTFLGNTPPPLINTASNSTAVIPAWNGSSGKGTKVVTDDSPTINNFLRLHGCAGIPSSLGDYDALLCSPNGGVNPEATLAIYTGPNSNANYTFDLRTRTGGVDTIYAKFHGGLVAAGLNYGIINIGAISASIHNTVHVYLDDPTAWGSGDLCSRANAAIAYGQCVDLSLGCVLHAEALVGAQNCASPFAPNRPAKLLLGQSTITATTKFVGPTNVGGDPSGLIIEGCGIDCTKITTNSGTSDIIDTGPVGAGLVNMQIRNLSLYSNVVRTAGCGISLTNGGAVENVKIVQTFNGVCMNTNGSGGSIKNTQLNCSGALGGNWNSGLAVGGLTAGNFVSNPFFEYVLISGCAAFATALVDINSGTDTPMFVGVEAVQNGTSNTAIQIRNSIGGGTAPRWVQFNGGDAEGGTASNGFEVTACNSCSINNMSIQTSLVGLHINGAGVTGFSFIGGRVNNIQQNAVKWDAGTGLDVSHSKLFDTGLAANNTHPIINVAAGVSNGKFAFNDTTSPAPQANKASTGLTIASGASDDLKVIGNTFVNLVATGSGIISNGGTGINQSFRDNTPEAINDDPFGGDFFVLTDEFQQNAAGAGAKTSTIGQLGWITTAITGCTGSVVQASSWPNLGIIQLQPVNVSGDGCSFTLGDANGAILGALGSNTTWEMVWIFKLTTTANITAKIGFGDVLTALTTTSHGMWLRDDTTVPDNAFKVCVATGAAETCDATTYTADTNFHKLRLFSTTVGTWQVQFDANTARTFCSSGCNTTVTVPTTAVFPIAQPITRAAAVNGMNIDFFSFKARGLTTSGRGN